MLWPFRNRGMVERTCLDCGQIWALKAAMAGRKPPRTPRAAQGSVSTDMRYGQAHSPFTKVGTDQFLAATHMHDPDAEDKDSEPFRQLQVCPTCSGSRYAQRRIRGHGDSGAPGASLPLPKRRGG